MDDERFLIAWGRFLRWWGDLCCFCLTGAAVAGGLLLLLEGLRRW